MGGSARRVLSAFEESKGAVLAQQEPPLSSHATTFGGVNGMVILAHFLESD